MDHCEVGTSELIGPEFAMPDPLELAKEPWWTGAMSLVNTILCPPHSAGQVLQIDVFQKTCALAKYRAIVQSNDGCFYGPPCNAPQVICIDPVTPDADFIGPDFCAGGFKWVTAGLGEDGCVYSPPWLAHKALRIDVPNRWARQIGKNHGWGGGKWEAMCAHEAHQH
eukprot:Skav222935  [mRNA]  locus=scaffold1489:457121:461219:+ [translate_table: standard]